MADASSLTVPAAPPRRRDFERWRRRSRLIRTLRILLPVLIALIFAGLVGSVVHHTVTAEVAAAADQGPIRLLNPRFVGRDAKGRAFVVTAQSAVRDQRDFQRVILDRPALVIDEGGENPTRLTSRSGVYHEGTFKLQLQGGVRLTSPQTALDTAASLYDTKTGELIGSGPIQGSGSLGEINARSYGVYDKGDRMVFTGGVSARIDSE
ncbi:LPS export ABC transporter periplasmic protein LptC [Phenylobacterium sp.]|jgi:lipopolysaccharide export system protein LptC|uniref:LPS export ABC transporter periplasmic protein LptC n=1 Tax=Phenylobacterium sp. TaxID=1871053 RepID=UPI002F3E8C7C